MNNLWEKIVEKQLDPMPIDKKISDLITLFTDDYSYILSQNSKNNKKNVIDELTDEQRAAHPKFIHKFGFVGKFKYNPNVSSNETKTNMRVSIPISICTENMSGILRFGPANLGNVNMLGFGFKFYSNDPMKTESIFNTLMIGGTADQINPKNPPNMGDVLFYSTDISSINVTANKQVNFLSKTFSDLTPNPNLLDVGKFISNYPQINFKFNSRLMKEFKNVQHTDLIVENVKNVINADMERFTETNTDVGYILGTIYVESNNYEKNLGQIELMEPVIVSNYANKYLFFQHNVLDILPDKPTINSSHVKKCPMKHMGLNENDHSSRSLCCRFFRRIKYYLNS